MTFFVFCGHLFIYLFFTVYVFLYSFAVNIGLDAENLAIHLNPRFNWEGKRNAIVCNCYRDGTWSDEQNHECFPFQQGKEFKV